MARTDAHRPYYVLEVDEPQQFTEWHDHRNGVCDLIPGEASAWPGGRGHCTRYYNFSRRLCSCSMCGGRHERRRERRWLRHVTRQLITDALKVQDWEGTDIWPKRWMAF